MSLLTLVAFAGVLVVFSSLHWRWAFCGSLIVAVFEGALRKWALPAAGNFIYFAKDLLLMGAYLGFCFAPRSAQEVKLPESLSVSLWMAVGVLGLQLFNRNSNSFLVSLIGLKPYFFYLPMLYLTRHVFRSREEFLGFLNAFLLLAIPVFLLGAFQFTQPPDSVWNKYAHEGSEENIATLGEGGEFARITATFSYITGLTTYIVVVLAFAVPLFLHERNHARKYALASVIVLAIGNTFMSGSRAPGLGVLLLLGGLFAGSAFLGTPAERRKSPWIIGIGAFAVVAAVLLFNRAALAIRDRAVEGAEEGRGRIASCFTEPWQFVPQGGYFGYGAGLTLGPTAGLQNALRLPGPNEAPPPAEVESTRVMLELGLPGFLAWYVSRCLLLWHLYRTWRSLRDTALRQIALCALIASFFFLSTGTVVNHLAGLFAGFLGGFVTLLPGLEEQSSLPAQPDVAEQVDGRRRRKLRGRLPNDSLRRRLQFSGLF